MSGGGALESSVTLEEVLSVLRAKRVPMAPELAGYLVLEVAQHADPSGGDVDPRSVFIGEEGTVALVKPRRDARTGSAETSVRSLLAELLDASGSQTPALAAASKRKSGTGLAGLADELETALIPVNRAAGRRALARLAREVRRVTLGVGRNALPSWHDVSGTQRRGASLSHGAASEPSPGSRGRMPSFSREEHSTARRAITSELLNRATPGEWTELPTSEFEASARPRSQSQADVDSLIEQFGLPAGGAQHHSSELKAMAGLDPTPPPPVATASLDRGADEGDEISALLRSSDETTPPLVQDSRQLVTQPSQLRRAQASIPAGRRDGHSRLSWLAPVLGMLAVAGGAYALLKLRPSLAPPRATAPERLAPSSTAPSAAPACRGTLVISNVPSHAEVLLGQGQAPVEVARMPVGARLEFVATAEGYAPKRLVVPSSTNWDTGPDGKPRLETAVQLDKSRGVTDSWPIGEPGEVGGQGPPGTVRIVSTPRGAEIWLLAGMGPDARVEQLPCDRDWDVLVAGPTIFRQRLHVQPRDFQMEAATAARVARVNVK
jgi:hypothetical protein